MLRAGSLEPGTITVWRISLSGTPEVESAFRRFLSFEETERADRFAFPHLTQKYVLARGALRTILAGYLDRAPESLVFEYNSSGKPALAGGGVHFNVSHSGSIALLAFAKECEIGVDVEAFRPVPDLESIADRFFCPEEARDLTSLPVKSRPRAFFDCWTRKEAYVKALGGGLSVPLDSFRVTLLPGEPARIVHAPEGSEGWRMHDLGDSHDYAAALAYRFDELEIRVNPLLTLTDHHGHPRP